MPLSFLVRQLPAKDDGVAKTHQLLRCSNCSRGFDVRKYASLLDNRAPCIWRFLLSHLLFCFLAKASRMAPLWPRVLPVQFVHFAQGVHDQASRGDADGPFVENVREDFREIEAAIRLRNEFHQDDFSQLNEVFGQDFPGEFIFLDQILGKTEPVFLTFHQGAFNLHLIKGASPGQDFAEALSRFAG
jgi:hypothetical protein